MCQFSNKNLHIHHSVMRASSFKFLSTHINSRCYKNANEKKWKMCQFLNKKIRTITKTKLFQQFDNI